MLYPQNHTTSSRRNFLRGSTASVLALAGLALGVPAQASSQGRALTTNEVDEHYSQHVQQGVQKQQLGEINNAGFDVKHAYRAGARLSGDEIILVVAYAALTDRRNLAAVHLMRLSRDRRTVESTWGISARPGRGTDQEAQPDGLKQFWGCFRGLVAAKCAEAVAECEGFEIWPLILTCIIGGCGPAAAEAAWDCKSAL